MKTKLSWLQDGIGLNRTLDLASTLEGDHDVGLNGETKSNNSSGQVRSVLTIAFQFAYEVHTRETCAVMARQYVRTVVSSVQRVAMALAPSSVQPRQTPGNSDAISLARHILSSYRYQYLCCCKLFLRENVFLKSPVQPKYFLDVICSVYSASDRLASS